MYLSESDQVLHAESSTHYKRAEILASSPNGFCTNRFQSLWRVVLFQHAQLASVVSHMIVDRETKQWCLKTVVTRCRATRKGSCKLSK